MLTLLLNAVNDDVIDAVNAFIPALTGVNPNDCNFASNEALHNNKFSELLSNLLSKDDDNWSTVNPAIV